jgi:hypothetical protein
MHAREFITTEEELQEAIDREFKDSDAAHMRTPSNIWQQGETAPNSASSLLQSRSTRKGGVELAQARMRRIAEELTGGKI